MASVYVLHRQSQLPTTSPAEGKIYPLLRRVGNGTDLSWAFAVPQAQSAGDVAARRKNRLLCATLRALGFTLDQDNASSGLPFDFFHLPDSQLIDPFPAAVFDPATLP